MFEILSLQIANHHQYIYTCQWPNRMWHVCLVFCRHVQTWRIYHCIWNQSDWLTRIIWNTHYLFCSLLCGPITTVKVWLPPLSPTYLRQTLRLVLLCMMPKWIKNQTINTLALHTLTLHTLQWHSHTHIPYANTSTPWNTRTHTHALKLTHTHVHKCTHTHAHTQLHGYHMTAHSIAIALIYTHSITFGSSCQWLFNAAHYRVNAVLHSAFPMSFPSVWFRDYVKVPGW